MIVPRRIGLGIGRLRTGLCCCSDGRSV